MYDQTPENKPTTAAVPRNKGKLIGQKPPLTLKQIWAIRIRLQMDRRLRDLALFDLAIDSKLRGCDLVRLRVRDLRRWGAGRESSFVYHWAKRSALALLVLILVVYLALPFSLRPTFVILPFATLFALSVAVTASSFKKYL